MNQMLLSCVVVVVLYSVGTNCASSKYFGSHIGRLSELNHGVSGDVYAVDSRTLFIKGFTYDGEGPAAYFYVGNSRAPSGNGFRIRDERGSNGVLKRYRNKDITLTLPEGKTLRDIKWFSVWCDEFSVDFGNVVIPPNLDFPRPQKIAGLNGIHAVKSDNIVIVDAQTLLIPNFSYDGVAPDAKFWVGRGPKPSPNGVRISDENGKEAPLRRYDRKTIVLTLPGELTVFDIGHFGVWCEAFTVDFGHVRIPEKINVPPSLKMLGISPQSKLNCEVLHDELAFEVRWAIAGESAVIQLVAKLDDNEYMSFGVSSDAEKSLMVGADVVVAWVNRLSGKGYAQDYILEAKSQCSGNHGSCPDTRLEDNSNSIRLLNAAIVNDYSIVTYQRPLKSADKYDQNILVNGSQAIVWAIGPLNQRFEVSYHSSFLKTNKFIDFGRQPFWNCPIPESEVKPLVESGEVASKFSQDKPAASKPKDKPDAPKTQQVIMSRPVPPPKAAPKNNAWEIPPIQCYEPEDGVFYAQMGPTGGARGYPAITGHVGWGISWYINGLLIPEINVVRGKTYTFVVEGGNDPNTPAKYHPFYITNDIVGGFEHKSDKEREKIQIYAGVHKSRDGKITPTGTGRICNWTPDLKAALADDYNSFGAYQRTLTLKCDEGEPGIITWTPDKNTPDTVYYQCFTHRHLGWRINVLDSCDGQTQASSRHEVYEDFEAEPSIQHELKVYPSENFLQQHEKDLIKHHNMNGAPPKVTSDFQKTGEFDKLISKGIEAAEALEKSILNDQKRNETIRLQPVKVEKEQPKDINVNAGKQRPLLRRPPVGFPPHRGPQPPPQMRPQPPHPMNPFYVPQKLPMRRPIAIERRPYNRNPYSPFLLPQQSIVVNHYKKPPYVGNRNFIKSSPKPISPVLLLGEPTEIKPSHKKSPDYQFYNSSRPQPDGPLGFKVKKHHESPRPYPSHKLNNKAPPKSPFKDPFDIKKEIIPLREAPNTGFKADTIIVESGFRPIFRREDVVGKFQDDSVEEERRVTGKFARRSDNFEDSSEDEELPAERPQNVFFEPMFIPSPMDVVAAPLTNTSAEEDDMQTDASERQDFFYLPPNEKRSTEAVLDTSLLKDPFPSQNDFIKLSPKTKQFIKDTPQFSPFMGELPAALANSQSKENTVAS